MTISTLTDQQRNSLSSAIWEFFSSCNQDENSYLLSGIGALLYCLKMEYLFNGKKEPDNEIVIYDRIGAFDKDSKYVCHIDDYPIQYDDIVVRAAIIHIGFLARHISNPYSILVFINRIKEYADGDYYYLHVFDLAISHLFSSSAVGQFQQPLEFGALASALLDVKGKQVFNPFAGFMNFATCLSGYEHFEGIEIEQSISDIIRYRLLLADIKDKAYCSIADVSNLHWPIYDVIVSTPPIGKDLDLLIDAISLKSELVCLYKFEEWTFPGGQLLTFVPPSVLFSSSNRYKSIREELTEKNYLDTVINLPSNLLLPYTSLALVAILLKKDRDIDAPIKMIDASTLLIDTKSQQKLDVESVLDSFNNMASDNCVFVSIDEIRDKNYNWNVSYYLRVKKNSFPEGYKLINLGNIVSVVRGEKRFEDQKGHFAMIAALSKDITDCVKPVEDFEITDDLSRARKITEPVILLSTIRELKPTYCEASKNNPIFIHSNVMALRITKEWVLPTYLCLELSRRFVPTVGVIPRFTYAALMETLIAFPSIAQQNSREEQNNLYNEAKTSFELAKANEQGFQSLIKRKEEEYINTVRMRKHDMMPYMRELGSVSRLLRAFIEKYGSSELLIRTDNLLSQFDNAYMHLSELLEVFSQENKYGNPERVNIEEYLHEYAVGHNNAGFAIVYNLDKLALDAYGLPTSKAKSKKGNPCFIDIAPLDLGRIIQNIVENARIHGFTDSNRSDYQLIISLSVVPSSNMFQIDFSNNGNPLPVGLNKERYGLLGEKAGVTGKSGQGGHIVKSIVEHYKGDYDIFMDGLNTVVRILLPISNSFE